MYKVVGKAYFETHYDGKTYSKVRYTLELEPSTIDRLRLQGVQGSICENVPISLREDTDLPQIGDRVVVSWSSFDGKRRPTGIYVLK